MSWIEIEEAVVLETLFVLCIAISIIGWVSIIQGTYHGIKFIQRKLHEKKIKE